MELIWVRAITDWPSGETSFTVEGKYKDDGGEPHVEKFQEALAVRRAVKRLESELARAPRVKRTLWKLGGYAHLFRAMARADVNPVYVEYFHNKRVNGVLSDPTLYTLQDILGIPGRILLGLRAVFSDITTLVTDILRDKFEDSVRLLKSGERIDRLWKVLHMLADVVALTSREPDKFDLFAIHYILSTLRGNIIKYSAEVTDELENGIVVRIFEEAAHEARDPDVKRLAELLAESMKKALGLVDYLESLIIKHLDGLAYGMTIQDTWGTAREQLISRLEAAARHVHQVEMELDRLASESKEILERLKTRGILLDRDARGKLRELLKA